MIGEWEAYLINITQSGYEALAYRALKEMLLEDAGMVWYSVRNLLIEKMRAQGKSMRDASPEVASSKCRTGTVHVRIVLQNRRRTSLTI